MKIVSILMSVVLALVIFGSAQADYEDTATDMIDLISIERGYMPLKERVVRLDQNELVSFKSYMVGHHTYKFVAVCDEDCTDVDLRLYDARGNLVARDTLVDDVPEIDITPRWSETFTVVVTMAQCNREPCRTVISSYRTE